MTYLSRIRINPLRAESRKLLTNPRAMHGAVMAGLPDVHSSERTLWRLDSDNPHRPHIYVLTQTKPDWKHLVESAGWPDADGDHAAVREYAPLLGQIATGREFAFRLTASPVQNTHAPTKPTPEQAARLASAETNGGKRPRGFRISHRTASTQLHWFLTRTERWGFHVPSSRTDLAAPGFAPDAEPPTPDRREGPDTSDSPDPNPVRDLRIIARQRHSFAKKPGGPRVTFHSVTFEGRLRVTDPDAFSNRLLGGIGPCKAYGCGLLTLAPLPGKQS